MPHDTPTVPLDDGLPLRLDGSILVTGPSNVGKTRLTARALDCWLESSDADGVVVLEFAPELERDGRVLGGRLDRFTTVPDRAWHGVLDAHAPRAEADGDVTALELARENACNARGIIEAAPEPRAVFVNDATIPFQSGVDAALLTDYCDRAAVAVCNAFDSDELGTDDPVSRNERAALATLGEWAAEHVRLD